MQTFLPYPSFEDSAKALDKRRCWKQVVEAKQIIDILELKAIKGKGTIYGVGNIKIGWQNHPAVKMWEGHLFHLKWYFDDFLEVAANDHGINTNYELYDQSVVAEGYDNPPWWLGNENFHRAMRARLIEKDRGFYLEKFPADEGFNGGKYFWPVMESKTFRII